MNNDRPPQSLFWRRVTKIGAIGGVVGILMGLVGGLIGVLGYNESVKATKSALESERIAKLALHNDSIDHRQDTIIDALLIANSNGNRQLDSLHRELEKLTEISQKISTHLGISWKTFNLYDKEYKEEVESDRQSFLKSIKDIQSEFSSFDNNLYLDPKSIDFDTKLERELDIFIQMFERENHNKYLLTHKDIARPFYDFRDVILIERSQLRIHEGGERYIWAHIRHNIYRCWQGYSNAPEDPAVIRMCELPYTYPELSFPN